MTTPGELHRRYWRKTLLVTSVLLIVWFITTFGVVYFARFLTFNFFGWPFSFWMGAQGSLMIYCLLVGFYAWYMNKLDAEHGLDHKDD
ncbi:MULTISPECIES: DUF4212 domain-containing protein [unclassified Polaromonas]|uniref:DUF4212 domain-containing protein n=1 Tax=unclassified Polaromonas TaxID=2638319 RepID=UPI0018CAA65A|nr:MULTISPECIES: DUF4212 domain-containing protein [unclassified Polaromonas]MBG6072113.1 putative solute:sodium symporter small subunit [Polaromonas sp. CG_9.7]MBG6114116.1 putative solute:sodium symporter small subunit [Polaromonas sp. CG_9.2]MDH6184799.1 putative solute:sodium symporter small subunit [Polaromonas sp. CG_23.6]